MAGQKFVKSAIARRNGKMGNCKSFPVLLTLLMMIFSVHADVPKIHYDLESRRPEVTPTGVWEKIASPGMRNNTDTPAGMLAYAISENGYLFNWRPSTDTSRISGQADIIGALLSQDESLLVIAERIGGAGKNNSTRLIFLNLINGKLCGGMDIPERRITAIANIPGENSKILAVQEGQSEFGNGNALLMIDLRRRRVRQITPDMEQPITSICTDGNKVWFAFTEGNRFGEIELDDSAQVRYCDTKKQVAGLNYNPASRSVIAYGVGVCEFFSNNHNGLFLEKSIELPAEFTAVWHLGVSQVANTLFLVDANGKALMVTPGGVVPVQERMEPYGCAVPGNTVWLGSSDRNKIKSISIPDCNVLNTLTPNSLRPHSRNKVRSIFFRTAVPPQIILLDERGNIFQIIVTGRRGKKTVLLLVDKNGIR